MIFLFAPALVSLALILAMVLREQFSFLRSVPTLDQIHAELTTRRLARESQRTSNGKRVLTFRPTRVLVATPLVPGYIAPQDINVTETARKQVNCSAGEKPYNDPPLQWAQGGEEYDFGS
jgi:hypothetical protein